MNEASEWSEDRKRSWREAFDRAIAKNEASQVTAFLNARGEQGPPTPNAPFQLAAKAYMRDQFGIELGVIVTDIQDPASIYTDELTLEQLTALKGFNRGYLAAVLTRENGDLFNQMIEAASEPCCAYESSGLTEQHQEGCTYVPIPAGMSYRDWLNCDGPPPPRIKSDTVVELEPQDRNDLRNG